MHIAFFIPDFRGGGAQQMIVNLANEFARRGCRVDLIASQAEGPFRDIVAGSVNVVALERKRVAMCILPLKRWLHRETPDVFLSALYHANIVALMAAMLAGGLRTKFIVTERNFFSRRVRQSEKLADKFMPFLVKRLYRRADKVVGISKGVAADIREAAEIPDHQVTWIHNPVVAPQTLRQLDEDTPADLPGTGGRPLVVASGRLVEQKDYPTLLKAFQKLREQKQARLLILGDGVLRPDMEALVATLGIDGDVHFQGYVANPLAYMKAADLFVISSQWEGFCNVIVEALLCGLPVVATDCPAGPAEILDNGAYGTLVPVGDAAALADSMAKALDTKTDSARQKKRAMDFSVEKIADRYDDLFRSITRNSKGLIC